MHDLNAKETKIVTEESSVSKGHVFLHVAGFIVDRMLFAWLNHIRVNVNVLLASLETLQLAAKRV